MPVETRNGKQVTVKEVDIPDEGLKQQEKVVLEPNIVTERNVRRYIRTDGVFRKDVRLLTPTPDNEDEAIATVEAICTESGREIEKDVITGRHKAVPGWDLAIRVPGMGNEERNAPKKPEGEAARKIQEELVVRLQSEVDDLSKKLAQVLASIPQPKAYDQMTHSELDIVAINNNVEWPEDVKNKEDKVVFLHKSLHPEG